MLDVRVLWGRSFAAHQSSCSTVCQRFHHAKESRLLLVRPFYHNRITKRSEMKLSPVTSHNLFIGMNWSLSVAEACDVDFVFIRLCLTITVALTSYNCNKHVRTLTENCCCFLLFLLLSLLLLSLIFKRIHRLTVMEYWRMRRLVLTGIILRSVQSR